MEFTGQNGGNGGREQKSVSDRPERHRLSFRRLLSFRLKYLLWMTYAFAGFVVFVLLLDKVIMPLYTKHGREVTMPDVTGMPVEEAMKKLEEEGFRPILDKEVFNNFVPKGVVISQNPLPESIVKKGRRTYLTVSKGVKWVRVPSLIGISERDAQLRLRQLELVPGGPSYEFSSFYPKGVVIAQSVPEGDSVSIGDTVHIVVSLGDIPEYLVVPNLIGRSLRDAKEQLLRLGFRLGIVTYQVNNDLLPETVIAQSIPPDSTVDVGTTIDLVVSTIEESGERAADDDTSAAGAFYP